MTAVADEQVRAGLEGRAEIEAAVAPARGPHDVAEVRADDRRPAALLGEPARHQPDDPDAPRPARRSPPRRAGSPATAVARLGDRDLHEVPPGEVGRLERIGVSAASAGSSASSSRAASSASPTRPAALSRGARANATVSRSTAAGAIAGAFEERRDARSWRGPQTCETQPGDRPVLADDRRHVRDRADRREVGELERGGRSTGLSARSSWATLNATPLPASRRSG